LRLTELKEAADVVDSRLRSASYQVGLIRSELSEQNIPVNNGADISDDSDEEILNIFYSEFHRPTTPLP
jgi:hypothetical protein